MNEHLSERLRLQGFAMYSIPFGNCSNAEKKCGINVDDDDEDEDVDDETFGQLIHRTYHSVCVSVLAWVCARMHSSLTWRW